MTRPAMFTLPVTSGPRHVANTAEYAAPVVENVQIHWTTSV